MDDVQNQIDHRRILIDQVGVSDLRCPIVVLDRQFKQQQTVATVTMSVNLPHHLKGTHMSRFVEVLNDHRGEVTMRTVPTILRVLKARLQAQSARMQVAFERLVTVGDSPMSLRRIHRGFGRLFREEFQSRTAENNARSH